MKGYFYKIHKTIKSNLRPQVTKDRWIYEINQEEGIENYLQRIKERIPAEIIDVLCDARIRLLEQGKDPNLIDKFDVEKYARRYYIEAWDEVGPRPTWFIRNSRQSQDAH